VNITAHIPGKRSAWAVVFVVRFVAMIANIGRRLAGAVARGQPRWPPGWHEWPVPNSVSPAEKVPLSLTRCGLSPSAD
jgi:hypothetical protein